MKYVWLLTVAGCVFFVAPASGSLKMYALQDTSSKKQPDTANVAPPDSTKKTAADSVKKKPERQSIDDKVKASKKVEGLFTLYRDTATASLQLYLEKGKLGKDFIYQ